VVPLTDARGITVDFLGDLVFEPSLRKAGLISVDWRSTSGTMAWAPASAPQALTVHLDRITLDAPPTFHSPARQRCSTQRGRRAERGARHFAAEFQPAQGEPATALQLVRLLCANDIEKNAAFFAPASRPLILRLSVAPVPGRAARLSVGARRRWSQWQPA
jgi:hypothetical protein